MNDTRTESRLENPLPYLAAVGVALLIACYLVATSSVPNLFRNQLTSDIKNVLAPEAKALVDGGALVIDVRDTSESAPASLPGALLIPLASLPAQLPRLEAHKMRPVLVVSGDGGALGPQAVRVLREAGFAHAFNLNSGIRGWRAAGYELRGG